MDESQLIVLIRASFSACFLVAAADGEISGDEIRTFMDELHERYDIELEEDEVVESFRDALEIDEEEHLQRIAEALSLPESAREDIISVALAVAASDGEIDLSEILCLPDIAAALDIELSEDEDSEDDGEVDEDEEDTETSEEFEAALKAAESALRAEGDENPSSADILLKASRDLMSGLSSDLKASVVQREGFAAYQAGDFDKARQLYMEAAAAGDADAMHNLGQMHMAGEGVPVDWGKALSWWLRAAEEGHLRAQRNAWKTLAMGQNGVLSDEAKAVEIATMAAAQGDEESVQFVREKTLSSLQASALVAASLMARADGTISDEEVVAFGDAWKEILGVDYTVGELRELFAENAGDQDGEEEVLERLSILGAHLPLEFRQLILQVSLRLAFADHDFRLEEQAMVEKLAASLDVDLADLGNGLGLRRQEDVNEVDGPSEPNAEEDFDPEINPVLVAALRGDADAVRSLLAAGHSATDVHESGTDAVILAVREGHLEIVELLIEAGADPNRVNPKYGSTPLRMAIQEKRTEIAKFLLRKGADADLFDEASGVGPLAVLVVVAAGFDDGEALHLLDLLISGGARQRPFRLVGQDFSIIGFAATKSGLPAGFLSRLARGCDKGSLDLALWFACIEGEATNVRDLLAAGADVNMTVPDLDHDPSAVGDSPINAAATRGYTECVRLLIDAGTDVNRNTPPEGGQFPLLMASENGHSEIVSMLLDAGADVSMINPENGTHALGGAVRGGHSKIVSLLLKAGADPNKQSEGYGGPLITFAAHDGYLDIVRSLIDHGADVDAAGSEYGNTALILAANQGHAEIIELLLLRGADLGLVNPVNGSDALLAAIVGEHTQCVKLLLEAGANSNRVVSGNVGDLPLLIFASDKGYAEIVRLLVVHGAQLDATDGEGSTALQRASIHRHKDVEAVLIELGADPDSRLIRFTDTPAGQEIQNELLRGLADKLDGAAEALRDTEAGAVAEKKEPEPETRGFWARLFGRDRRP